MLMKKKDIQLSALAQGLWVAYYHLLLRLKGQYVPGVSLLNLKLQNRNLLCFMYRGQSPTNYFGKLWTTKEVTCMNNALSYRHVTGDLWFTGKVDFN